MKRNPVKRLIFLLAAVLTASALSGCGCWPLREQEIIDTEWQPQTLSARLTSADTAIDECRAAIKKQCDEEAASACRDHEGLPGGSVDACMVGKGYKNVETTRKSCYLKVM
jgi:hypothetical protein